MNDRLADPLIKNFNGNKITNFYKYNFYEIKNFILRGTVNFMNINLY